MAVARRQARRVSGAARRPARSGLGARHRPFAGHRAPPPTLFVPGAVLAARQGGIEVSLRIRVLQPHDRAIRCAERIEERADLAGRASRIAGSTGIGKWQRAGAEKKKSGKYRTDLQCCLLLLCHAPWRGHQPGHTSTILTSEHGENARLGGPPQSVNAALIPRRRRPSAGYPRFRTGRRAAGSSTSPPGDPRGYRARTCCRPRRGHRRPRARRALAVRWIDVRSHRRSRR